jgi:hypothetical protein
MQKLNYLKLAIESKAYRDKSWVFSIVSQIQEGPEDYLKNPFPYRLVQTMSGFYFVDPQQDNKLTMIDGIKAGEPLFTFTERIAIDPTWCANLKEDIETTLGRLLVNLLAIVDVFNVKIPYINKPITVDAVESIIAKKLKDTPAPDTPRDSESIYVDEYNRFIDRLQFIAILAPLCVWSATKMNVVAPVGITEYRDQLVKEYGDKLTDPAHLAEFEDKLREFDTKYLADDPTNGKFLSGDMKNIRRKKLFLTSGAEMGFKITSKVSPVISSLSDGWGHDQKDFVSSMNGLRAGSYARGTETIKGGVTAKTLLRSLGSFKIVDNDCGSTMGLKRTFTKDTASKTIGRYMLTGNKSVVIDDDTANSLIDKEITLRSPLYCRSEGETFCRYCVGDKLALSPEGLSLAVTDVSNVILYSFMKLMHGKRLSTAHYDFNVTLS